MKKINKGVVAGNTYKKIISINRAVLWKDRQISIHKSVVEGWFKNKDIKHIWFEDRGKSEIWITTVALAERNWILKKEGQEPQYYIPIEIFRKYKGTDYISLKNGIKRIVWRKKDYETKEEIRLRNKQKVRVQMPRLF